MEHELFLGKSIDFLKNHESFIKFNQLELEKIGEDIYLGGELDGIVFSFINGTNLTQIDYYSDGYNGFAEYLGTLPKKISFQMSQDKIHTILGQPDTFQNQRTIPVIGKIPAAESYNFERYRLLLRYSEDLSSLLLITITAEMH